MNLNNIMKVRKRDMFKLFKKKAKVMEAEKLPRQEVIANEIDEFLYQFHYYASGKELDIPELPDDVLTEILTTYFDKKTLSEANKYFYDVIDKYVPDPYKTIDWDLGRPAVEETPEYKAWRRHSDIDTIMYDCKRILGWEKTWVDLNGKANTNEEAAQKAADKWCEIIFGDHIQDNGAMNEDHPGGFYACALGTLLADKSKESITEEMVTKAHNLFKEYYLHELDFNTTLNNEHLKWLKETLPSTDDHFDWKYGFYDLSCDYGPSWALYLILYHAGVPERNIDNICPWKTSIHIRKEDNAVMYRTYQHCDEL